MKTLEQLKEEVRLEQEQIAAEQLKYSETRYENLIKTILRQGGVYSCERSYLKDEGLALLQKYGVKILYKDAWKVTLTI